MLTGFFYIELKYIRIKMLGSAKNVNHATSFAGLLIRKDCACLIENIADPTACYVCWSYHGFRKSCDTI